MGAPPAPRRDRSGQWLAVPVAAVLAVAVFLVLPYYVNGLHRFPLDEVAGGGYDRYGLWPYADGGVLAVVWAWGSLIAVVLGPVSAWIATMAALAELVWPRNIPRRVGRALVTLALGVAVLAWFASPMGSALLAWWID